MKIKNLFPKLPKCYGAYYPATEMGPAESDCLAPANDLVKDDVDYDCEHCLASFDVHGGTIHPETGKKMPYLLARILYGKPTHYIPTPEEQEKMRLEKFFDEMSKKRSKQ
jgi:hypothetical protein